MAADCPSDEGTAINRLDEHFDRQIDQIKSRNDNESQLRVDFVKPMFRDLGWDIDNTQQFAEERRGEWGRIGATQGDRVDGYGCVTMPLLAN